MASTCVVGLQWGDEAKGKIVDLLTRDHHIVVRYNGGANAGHTIVKDGTPFPPGPLLQVALEATNPRLQERALDLALADASLAPITTADALVLEALKGRPRG